MCKTADNSFSLFPAQCATEAWCLRDSWSYC